MLRYLAAEAARSAFTALRDDRPGEAFYGFALVLSPTAPHLTAAANTEEALRRTAERYAADGYGTAEALAANAPGSLRWRTPNWEYRTADAELSEEAEAAVAQIVEGSDWDDAAGGLARELVGAIRDLNREDFFGWGPDRDAVVVLIDTDDPDDLLEHARDINPATPFARLQAGLGLS